MDNLKKELKRWFAEEEESIATAKKVMQHHNEGFEKLMVAVRERNEKSGLSISPPIGGKVSLFTMSSSRSSVASKASLSSGSGVTTRSSSSTRSVLATSLSTESKRKANQMLHGNLLSSRSARPQISPPQCWRSLEFGDNGDDISAYLTQRDSAVVGFHRTAPAVFNKDEYLTRRRMLITSAPQLDELLSSALSTLDVLPQRLASLTAADIRTKIFGCKSNGEPRYKEFESDFEDSSRTVATVHMQCRRVVPKSKVSIVCCRCRDHVPVNKAVQCYRQVMHCECNNAQFQLIRWCTGAATNFAAMLAGMQT